MRISTKMMLVGVVLVLFGVLSQAPLRVTEMTADSVTKPTPISPSPPEATVAMPVPTTALTRTPLPVTVLPTATTIIYPTAQPVSVDTVVTNANMYRESFTDTRSGWEPYYSGDGGAWNGYGANGYAFQLANDMNIAGGRRLWDFNTCCVLDSQYEITLEAQSQTPQRGMVITEYVGNFVDMQTASGIVILFDIGYNMQPRPNALQIVMLQQGFLSGLNCVGETNVTVGPRMKIDVTVVNGLLVVELTNRDINQHTRVKCGLNTRTPDRKLLGIGTVRAVYSANQAMMPIEYTYLQITGIDNYITDTKPEAFLTTVSAGCGALNVYTFEDWLREDIMNACPAY